MRLTVLAFHERLPPPTLPQVVGLWLLTHKHGPTSTTVPGTDKSTTFLQGSVHWERICVAGLVSTLSSCFELRENYIALSLNIGYLILRLIIIWTLLSAVSLFLQRVPLESGSFNMGRRSFTFRALQRFWTGFYLLLAISGLNKQTICRLTIEQCITRILISDHVRIRPRFLSKYVFYRAKLFYGPYGCCSGMTNIT